MYANKKINLDLDSMLSLLSVLNHPEKRVKNVIHVAGTNGKGSTCAFLLSILQSMRYSVNLYTSPHLVKINERIKLHGQDVSDCIFHQYREKCEKLWHGKDYTFFELLTAMAFCIFAEHSADFNIFEVGLGGELDATNLVNNVILSIITSISMDHVEMLGPNIKNIAQNKAGIIKQATPVILSKQQRDEVVTIIDIAAKKMQAPLYRAEVAWETISGTNSCFHYRDTLGWCIPELKPPLAGNHQYDNLSTAIFACHLLKQAGKIKTLKTIDNKALSDTHWPARIQRIHILQLRHKEIILDGSHNEDSIHALANYLQQQHQSKTIIGIFGCLQNKDLKSMIPYLRDIFSVIYCVAIDDYFTPSSKNPHAIAQILNEHNIKAIPVPADKQSSSLQIALNLIAKDTQKNSLVIFGSLHLAGQVLSQHSQ